MSTKAEQAATLAHEALAVFMGAAAAARRQGVTVTFESEDYSYDPESLTLLTELPKPPDTEDLLS